LLFALIASVNAVAHSGHQSGSSDSGSSDSGSSGSGYASAYAPSGYNSQSSYYRPVAGYAYENYHDDVYRYYTRQGTCKQNTEIIAILPTLSRWNWKV